MAEHDPLTHVVIIGAMGVGKSTLGEQVAAVLGRPHRDSDADIQRLLGRTGAEIAADLDGDLDGGTGGDGVATLHELERAVLLGALAADDWSLVISAAASVVENFIVRRALKRRAYVVHLDAPTEVLLARQSTGDHRRAMDGDELAARISRRRPFTDEVTDLELDGTRPPETLVAQVIAALADHRTNDRW